MEKIFPVSFTYTMQGDGTKVFDQKMVDIMRADLPLLTKRYELQKNLSNLSIQEGVNDE